MSTRGVFTLFPTCQNHNPNAVWAFYVVILAVNFPVVLDSVGEIRSIESFHFEDVLDVV